MTTTYVNPNGQLLPSHCQRTSGVTFHCQYRSGTYVIEGSCEVLPEWWMGLRRVPFTIRCRGATTPAACMGQAAGTGR
jgi:hypothetical protein